MTAPGLFEIVPLSGDPLELPAPDNGPYYVAAKNGMFAMQHTHWGRYLVPVATVNHLPEIKDAVFWNDIPKMPATLIGQVLSFFQAIYAARKSEAMVDLTWSPEKGYRAFVPPQRASGGGVEATRNWEHIHGLHVGTIHSHCMMTAFHSTTDEHDADGHNGLHITIGRVATDKPEYAVMFSHNGHRWDKNFTIEDVVDGPITPVQHPVWWEKFVQDPIPMSKVTTYTPRTPTAWHSPRRYTPAPQNNAIIVRNGKPDPQTFHSLTSLALTAEFSNKPFEDEEVEAMQTILEEVEGYFARLGVRIEFAFDFSDARFDDIISADNNDTDDLPWRLLS